MAKTLLTALVTVILHNAAGARVEIPPGEEIPDGLLSKHDIEALKASKSIEDSDETDFLERRAQRSEEIGNREFEEARRQVAADKSSRTGPVVADAASQSSLSTSLSTLHSGLPSLSTSTDLSTSASDGASLSTSTDLSTSASEISSLSTTTSLSTAASEASSLSTSASLSTAVALTPAPPAPHKPAAKTPAKR